MSMPENSLDNLCFDDVIAPDDDDDASERLYFDIDTLFDMIDDPPESPRNKSEDSLVNVVPQGLRKLEEPSSVGIERPGPDACSFSQNLEVSDNRAGSSEGSSSSAGKAAIFDGENQYGYAQNGTPMCSLPGSHADWNSQRSSNYSQDISYELQGLTHNLSTGNSDVTHGSYVDLVENSSQSLGAPNMEESAILNASLSSQSALYGQFGDYEYGDIEYPVTKSPDTMEFYDQDSIGSDSTSYFGPPVQCSTDGFGNQSFENNAERMAMNNKYGMLHVRTKSRKRTRSQVIY